MNVVSPKLKPTDTAHWTKNGSGNFLAHRLHRLRRTESLRRMMSETELNISDFIYPLFVVHGSNIRREIASMPGNFHWSLDKLATEAESIAKLGIPAVILFGLPKAKNEHGSEAYAEKGIVQQAVRVIKKAVPNLIVITDLCLCEYTSHGHCGILQDGRLINDATLEYYQRIAISQAAAGSDIVAPSGMMDGQVGAIRAALDANGFQDTAILAYSAKYASSFYGPFREAADSPPKFGDRKAYQMNPSNARDALLEIRQDIEEGADIVMIKPALAYLDVIHRARENFSEPIAAYNVSGEYAMVKAASRNGWIDEQKTVIELLTGIKRAGADVILSYHAKDVAQWLREG
jgi:porphobilinogen synthase